jgi:hypothetical protein
MLLFNSDNFMERAKELLQEEIEFRRQETLKKSKHPWLKRFTYGVLNFCSDKGISCGNTYWIEQKKQSS